MRPIRIATLLHLQEGDQIVTAYAQPAAGPGWANQPLWVIVRDRNGKLREECLQPQEQPKFILVLYDIAADCHSKMVGLLRSAVEQEKRARAGR